jgi:hypothetical protein
MDFHSFSLSKRQGLSKPSIVPFVHPPFFGVEFLENIAFVWF